MVFEVLKGLRIVEGSAFVAAPLGGMTLAQLGADVIRFDPIGGGLDADRWPVTAEGRSIYWAGLNKGKRSLAVDIRSPKGRELVTRLVAAGGAEGGIFSTNLPARGWLAFEEMRKARPDLIALNILGTREGAAQVDYTVNASAGFPLVTGPVGHEGPVNQVLPAWDIATGYAAAAALLAAERHRRLTGQGQLVKLALQDVALAATATLGYFGEAEVNKVDRPRFGNHIFGTFGRDFRTRDGRHVMICIFTDRQLAALAKAGGLGEAFARIERERGLDLKNEAHRWEAREAIAAAVEGWVSATPLGDVSAALDREGALWAPYQTFREIAADEKRVAQNPMFSRIEQPGIGSYWVPGSPYDFSGFARQPPRPAPMLGQHTDEILSGVLGLADGEIARLHDEGVVAGPRG